MDQMLPIQLASLRKSELEAGELGNLHTTFIQNVSHEFRTPLTIISGYATLLCDGSLGPLAPEQQEAASAIADRADELRAMMEKIDTLLAVEAHLGISVQFALDEIIAAVVEAKRTVAAQAALTLEAYLEVELPLVSGDPYQLRQVIECLLDNALKFTPAGGQVKVEVGTGPGWVYFAVTDTGLGMAEDELKRIFTGFYQVDGSTTRRTSGIGLGLTVAKAVVEAHGGHIEVHSQPGRGSRFTVRLPIPPSDSRVSRMVEEEMTLQRILIVDDEETAALALQEGLKRLPGCEVTIATSGKQALRLSKQQPFDLLIADYNIPGVDGITLASRIRQLYPRTATIILTAHGCDALHKRAARASIQHVLHKPVGLAVIRNVALETLARSTHTS